MRLTDSLFLVTSEEKEKEGVSGECSSTSLESTIQDGEGKSFFPCLGTGLSCVTSEERFRCVCVSLYSFLYHNVQFTFVNST